MIVLKFISKYKSPIEWGCDVMVAMLDSKSNAARRVSSTLTSPTMNLFYTKGVDIFLVRLQNLLTKLCRNLVVVCRNTTIKYLKKLGYA